MSLSRQLIIFGIVGTVGFIVDVAVLYATFPLLGWYAGRILSFWLAATTTWLLNRIFTFNHTAAQHTSAVCIEYIKYIFSMLAGGALNYGVYAATLHFVSPPFNAFIGVAFGSIAGLFVNFASARFLVFRSKTPHVK